LSSALDKVTLRFSRKPEFLPLLRLILGGIGARANLSFDAVDDIQLAVDNLIAEDRGASGDLSMCVVLEQRAIRILVGELANSDLYDTLKLGEVPEGAVDRCVDVCLLLRSLVDSYEVLESDGGLFAVEIMRRME